MAHCAYWLTDILSFDHPATSVRCAGRSPLVQTRRLRIRILQSEKGDKLELAPVWLQQGSLLPLLCWAPSYLLCSVTQWNEKKEKRILCFSILLSSRCHRPSNSALSSCCPTALCGKENWRSTPVCAAGSCSLFSQRSPSCPDNMTKRVLDRPHTIKHSWKAKSCIAQASMLKSTSKFPSH